MSIRNTAAVAALGMLCLARPCLADTEVLDPGSIEPLKPHAVVKADSMLITDELTTRFGLWDRNAAWQATGSDDRERTASYLRQIPYPHVRFERTDKSGPLSGYGPGVEQVFAYRHEWVSDSPDSTKRIVWRWEPPAGIKRQYPAWVGLSGRERYWFLCLYPQPSEGRWKSDPVVLCFDSTSGLKWRTALPVVSDPGIALADVGKYHRGYFSSSPDLRGHVGSTPDGGRVVALVYPYPDRDMTWMYVLDGDGAIVRALAIPDREGVASPAARSGHILRCGGEGSFVVVFRHKASRTDEDGKVRYETDHESYLIDRDGSFLRKFVDEEGRVVRISMSGERYALAGRPGKDGGWEHLIYKLP